MATSTQTASSLLPPVVADTERNGKGSEGDRRTEREIEGNGWGGLGEVVISSHEAVLGSVYYAVWLGSVYYAVRRLRPRFVERDVRTVRAGPVGPGPNTHINTGPQHTRGRA